MSRSLSYSKLFNSGVIEMRCNQCSELCWCGFARWLEDWTFWELRVGYCSFSAVRLLKLITSRIFKRFSQFPPWSEPLLLSAARIYYNHSQAGVKICSWMPLKKARCQIVSLFVASINLLKKQILPFTLFSAGDKLLGLLTQRPQI